MVLLLRFGLLLAAVFFILLAVFGLFRFSIEVGVSPMRYVVQDVGVVLAGVMGLAGCWWYSRQLQKKLDAPPPDPPAFTGDRFEARVRQNVQILALAFFGLLSLACLKWAMVDQGVKPVLVTAIMVGVTLLLGGMMGSMYRKGEPPALRMDTRGLTHPWYGHIPWAEVAGMNFQETQVRSTWICMMVLGVSAPDRFYRRMPWVARIMQNKWPATGQPFGALQVPLNPLDKPPREIYAAAWALRHRVQPAMLSHWQAPPIF